jgi:hypothetical protein
LSSKFLGFDHVDTRVRSLTAVEPFYDKLMPVLGLPKKRYANVNAEGEWDMLDGEGPHNAAEYHEEPQGGYVGCFIGFIEDSAMKPTDTRIAFRIEAAGQIERWFELLMSIGARNIECSGSETYPALFFEDPAGTKLELLARRPR